MRFLDTNILIRYLTWDIPAVAEQARQLLKAVESGEESIALSPLVVFEATFVSNRSYGIPLPAIRDALLPILHLPTVNLDDKHLFDDAFALAIEHNISFVDAYNAAYMRSRGLSEIYSLDRHFDRVDGITRIEPGSNQI